ncbi:P-loop containing nucleoside triphosphate hydrolase protein [Lichtheimia hyalospora FSU 10163]|nr:P-loop containing nucleoside triphosphate hydrolase protein [Lichtheimia hyalospora FSU 10163]
MAKLNYNTQTVLRVRPALDKTTSDDISTLAKSYAFDRVFGSNSTQDQIFRGVASNLVDKLIQGRNATLLVYGHPLSGKTYTLGSGVMEEQGGNTNAESEGLIPRATDALFDRVHRNHHVTPRPSSSFSSSIRSSSPSRLRPVSVAGLPTARRGSTPNLSSKSPRYTIRITFTRFDHSGNNVSLLNDDESIIRNTGDVLRNLDVAAARASESSSWSHAIFTIHLRQEKWTTKPPATVEKKESVLSSSKRRISTLNVKAMVGQMEKQARHDDDNGEWVTTESQLNFIEMGSAVDDIYRIVSCLDDLTTVIACVDATMYPRAMIEQQLKHANQWSHISLEQWIHEWINMPTMSPSTSTSMSDTSDDDGQCRSSSSARTTITIPEVADLERQIEELQNQVTVTQERNKHVEQELLHKQSLSAEREQAVSMYMAALERRINTLLNDTSNTNTPHHQLIAIDRMFQQLRTCVVSNDIPSLPPPSVIDTTKEESLQRKVDSLEQQLTETKQEHKNAVDQLTTSMEEKAASQEKLLQERHAAQLDEIMQQHNAFSESVHININQRLTENGRLQQQLDQLLTVEQTQDSLIDKLMTQVTQHAQVADVLKQQLTANEESMTLLRHENQEKARLLEDAQSTIDGLMREIACLGKEKHELDMIVKYVDSSIHHQNSRVVNVGEQLVDLQHAHTHEIKALKEEKHMLQQQVEQLEKQLVDQQQQQKEIELEQRHDDQDDDDDDDDAEGDIRNIILGLEARLQTLQQTKRQDEDEFDVRFERAVEDLEHTRKQNKDQAKTIVSLEQALESATTEQQRLMDKVAQLAQENAQLASQMSTEVDSKRSSDNSNSNNNSTSPRVSLMSTASLPPPTAPPSNPLPPIPTALPALPATSSSSPPSSPISRPQSPTRVHSPPPVRTLLQRQNSGTTTSISELLDESNPSPVSTAERYERIIQSLRHKMHSAEQDIKAHQDVIGKLECQLSRSEHTVREVKRQLDVLSREKQASHLEIQNLRSQVSAQSDAAKTAEDIQSLEDALEKERQLKEKAEKARHILEHRMEELMSKKSKFMCF